jgi:hypothetical protein
MARTRNLKRLGRVKRLTSLKALPDLEDRKKRKGKATMPEFTLPSEPAKDDFVSLVAHLYGDDRLAGRVAKLKQEFPAGSVPELVVYDWLRWRGVPFEYQVALFGGWARAGGLVPDFMLLGNYSGAVLQVQGEYWHSSGKKQGQDLAAKLKLLGSSWNGYEITRVTNVWEGNLRNKATRQRTLDLALGGVELPGGY